MPRSGRDLGRDLRRDLPQDVRATSASTTRRPRSRAAARLAGVEPPAEVLDAPTGFGRHALPLAKLGFHVTGVDRSASSSRRRDGLRARSSGRSESRRTSASCPSRTRASTPCSASSSIGYRGEESRQAFAQFLRVLRSGAPLVIETLHRDRLMAIFQERGWEPLEDGRPARGARLRLRRRGGCDEHTYLSVGERRSVTFRLRCYTATELVKLLAEVGFTEIECFGDFEGAPLSRETRLVVRAQKP